MGSTTNKRRTNCTTACSYNNFCERENKNEMWMIGMSNWQYIPCFFAGTMGLRVSGKLELKEWDLKVSFTPSSNSVHFLQFIT